MTKAQETGFCQRSRKLSPRYFLEMLLCKCFAAHQESLMGHALDLKLHRDVDIKKQSLHTRFTDKAVRFVKSLVSSQLSRKFSVSSKILDAFPSVIIHDSTGFGLPASFATHYAGYGGRGPAGAKIQFAYDLKTHQMCHATLNSSRQNDLTDSKNNDWVTEGALVLRDLGYYSHEGLKEIENKRAFFLSKVKPKTAFFDLHGKRIDLGKVISTMKKNHQMTVEKDLLIGHEGRFRARVIFAIVPDEIKNKRLKAVTSKAKNRKYTVQKEYKVWAGMNVFITNANPAQLTCDKVMDIYRLRWQVELVFKTWKSHYQIDRYKTMRKERMECYLYATLLLIVLQWRIFSWLGEHSSKNKLHVSLYKFTMLMVRLKSDFNEAVVRRRTNIETLLKQIMALSNMYLFKENKKGKVCFADIVNEEHLCIP